MAVEADPWGLRTADWVEVQEPFNRPLYSSALDIGGVGPGTRYLDAACGAGLALAMADELNADCHGFDRSEGMLAFARDRLRGADIRVGELEQVPFEDDSFDVVSSFNGVQFADDVDRALAELVRVAKPEAHVVVAIWAAAERNDMRHVLAVLDDLLPRDLDADPRPPAGPFAMSDGDRLERVLQTAGLRVEAGPHVACPFTYPDMDTALRGITSAGPFAMAIEELGEERVRDALRPALEQFERGDGSVRLHNEFRYVVGHT